jgi:hypothetical protein
MLYIILVILYIVNGWDNVLKDLRHKRLEKKRLFHFFTDVRILFTRMHWAVPFFSTVIWKKPIKAYHKSFAAQVDQEKISITLCHTTKGHWYDSKWDLI